jgi:hypothetical protein
MSISAIIYIHGFVKEKEVKLIMREALYDSPKVRRSGLFYP